MPAAPELGDVAAEVGHFEVAHQADAEEFGGADGDVTVTREVTVYLYGEECGCHDQMEAALVGDIVPDVVHIDGAVVGHHHLLEEAPEHLSDAVDGCGIVKLPLSLELWQQVGGAFDGACHQLGEEAYIGEESHHVACGFQLATIDIY